MDAIFLDIETTGLDSKVHKPIDVAFKIVDLTTHEVKAVFQSLIQWPREIWDQHDPVSIEINGYSWDHINSGITAQEAGEQISEIFTKTSIARGRAVFICQNPSFDRSFFNQLVPVYTQEKLNWPYHWLDLASMYWTKLIEKSISQKSPLAESMSLSKNSIAAAIGLPPEESPHRAINGVNHLMQCYFALLHGKNFIYLS
jgi:oligoribonuclease